ncbi:MAG: UDP-galactopyranose mutase [Rickettsiales bacterium]|jgi:UDP-galactopyranose mutase|nr:UDP-galactopyranose mutase [Rickettsiales bacterium]
MMAKNLIVGCGISGATLARRLADDGHNVVIIDSKNHIAGNIYDYHQDGIFVHKYGTHIFHTSDKNVWDFVSGFCQWYPYQHKVRGLIDGQIVPIPFNLNSLHSLFPRNIADKIEQKLLDNFALNTKVPILELRKKDDKDLQFLAQYIYDKIFLEYTLKQWGQTPDEIDPSVSGRVPVYISRDDRYFQDKYQGIPIGGYTKMINNMLDHKNIRVKLKTPYKKAMASQYDKIFWTGSIDEFFDYQHGELPYRSERFEFIEYNYEKFQDVAVVNYPNNYDFTRIGEYKHFLNDQSKKTIVSYEYPEAFENGKNDRYYPIANEKTADLYEKYLKLAQKKTNVYFLGRLGHYKYYDMDKAVAAALKLAQEI